MFALFALTNNVDTVSTFLSKTIMILYITQLQKTALLETLLP